MSPVEKEVPQAPITFTADQLTAMLRELRKPPELTEEQQLHKQQEVAMRKQMAQEVDQRNRNRKLEQDMCTHMRVEDNSTRTVYVQNGNYLICQACQKIIRPEEDVRLFNIHFGAAGKKTTF